jgi:hypothetical protein
MRNITRHFIFGIAAACLLLTTACSEHQFALMDTELSFGQTVTYNNKVDILWVVDSSSSMSQHQQKIAEQVSVFVNALRNTGMDFHIGVTTMDMSSTGEKGRLLNTPTGTPTVLKASTGNLTSILQTRLQMGDGGSSIERALEATKLALSEPLKSGYNVGFRRDDAVLTVIYLSNEDDESGSAVPDPVAMFDGFSYQSMWGDEQWVVNFIGTTPEDPNCTTVPWTVEHGLKYIELAEHSGGSSNSICSGDFSSALTNIKGHILTMITEQYLGVKKPQVNTIKVYINGQLIPQGATNGWTYHADRNSIKFHGTAIPPVGSKVFIDFVQEGF